MKRITKYSLVIATILGLIIPSLACIKIVPAEQTSAALDWKYKQTITSPIKGEVGSQPLNLGDLNTNNVKVNFAGNTFKSSTSVTVQTPTQVPLIDSNALTPIDSPVEISTGAPVRLYSPATLVWKVSDKNKNLAEMKRNNIWITYYSGKNWEYLKPDSYDLDQGLIYFTTYHLSLFGFGKIDKQQKIADYIHSSTVAEVTQKDILDAAVNNVVKNALEDMLLDKYKMDEESVKYKILTSLANDDDYREIIDNLYSVNIPEANKKLQVIIGKKIAENVGESALKGMLEHLTSDTGFAYTEAAVKAAANFAEGQYKEGIRIAGEAIANSFQLTKLVRGAGEVVQYHIDQWKDGEIEAAYKVFKNGAVGGYWGYSVDAGRFDDLWNQMRGISTKIEADAVKAEIDRRTRLSMRPATPQELDAIRAKAKEELRKQFENRAKRDAEIEKEEAKKKQLFDSYTKEGLLKNGDYGFDDAIDINYRFDSLLKIRNMIIADSGRKGWSMSPFSNEKTVGVGDIILLTKAWYSSEAEYKKQLLKIFGVDKDKGAFNCSIAIDPQKLEGSVGTQYTFTASAKNIPASVRYDWTINGKKTQSDTKNSFATTFDQEGQFQIMVVMYDNATKKDLCDAIASATIKAKNPPPLQVNKQPPPQEANKTPVSPSGGGSASGTFPASAFNGMQITYSVSGASITSSQDSEGFTVSRTMKGTLGSGQLTVSGSGRMGSGYYADLVVRVSAGGETKDFKANIKTGWPSFNEQPFSVSVPIPNNSPGGSFSIEMTGSYNAGTRGLIVSGTFAGSGGSSAGPSTTSDKAGSTSKDTPSQSNNPITDIIGKLLDQLKNLFK